MAGAPPGYPETLAYVIQDAAGQEVGAGLLSSSGGADFSGQWPPLSEAQFRLKVTHAPAGLESAAISFRGDLTPPSVWVDVPKPARPETTAVLTWIDPETGYESSWRRDEQPVLTLGSDSDDIEASSFAVAVRGVGSEDEISVPATATTGCGSAFCARAVLDLAAPPMKSFRGEFALRATVRDLAGNIGTAAGVVKVTRWRWKRVVSDRGLELPVVGHAGANYWVDSYAGALHAISPDGRELWRKEIGPRIEDLMVSEAASGGDRLYVALVSGSGTPSPQVVLHQFNGSDGSNQVLCQWSDRDVSQLVSARVRLGVESVGSHEVGTPT